jgi:hypothetical protein
MAVEFIETEWGPEAIGDIIREFRLGVTADQALITVLGVDTASLDALFRAWLIAQA